MIQKLNSISLAGWLKNRLFEIKHLIRAIYLRYPLKLIKYQGIGFLSYGLVYPLARIIFGKEKAYKISESYLDNFLSEFTVPLPPPLRGKITTIDGSNYINYFSIYMKDMYLQEFLRKGMCVIDVGANIGLYTVLAAEKVGNTGKVIAIEPEQRNYRQLVKNIEMNNLQNVTPVEVALSDHCGFEKLYLRSSSVSHSLFSQEDKNSDLNVQVTTLDKLTERLGAKRVDMIKINAEGAEISTLKGAKNVLRANPNMKIILLCDHYPSEKNEVCQFLNDGGFKTKTYYENIVTTI